MFALSVRVDPRRKRIADPGRPSAVKASEKHPEGDGMSRGRSSARLLDTVSKETPTTVVPGANVTRVPMPEPRDEGDTGNWAELLPGDPLDPPIVVNNVKSAVMRSLVVAWISWGRRRTPDPRDARVRGNVADSPSQGNVMAGRHCGDRTFSIPGRRTSQDGRPLAREQRRGLRIK